MEKKITINEEKIAKMTDSSLLSLVLSSSQVKYYSLEKSSAVLRVCENSLNMLFRTSLTDLQQACGIPLSDGYRLKAALELANRRQVSEILDKPKISCARDAYQLFVSLSECRYEEFHIIILNKANRVIERKKISEGGVSGTVVDLKRIFHDTLALLGSSLILIHNHPSGNLNPSDADKTITKKIKEAGLLMDIAVLDHIIVSSTGYFSFADEGVL
jgi:DNA repair protein RadC